MPCNYIITCGTSQIEEERLVLLGFTPKLAHDFRVDCEGGENAQGFFDDHKGDTNHILATLKGGMVEAIPKIGTDDNPLGAEISTLLALKQQHPNEHGVFSDASATILASDSTPGYFCARILQSLLLDSLGFSTAEIKIVADLREDPDSQAYVDAAMKNLVEAALNALSKRVGGSIVRNTIVMTGGFKSTIPCLTLFAMLNESELVYLFEKSAMPQIMIPLIPLKKKDNRDKWIEIWQYVLEKGNVDRQSYLYLMLQHRIENRESVYFS